MRRARLRPIKPVDEDEDPTGVATAGRRRLPPAILAVVAVAAALYFAREPLIPVVTAFVVGVMLSPAARALEERKVPRLLTAALMAVGTALVIGVVVTLIASPMADLAGRIAPQIGAKLEVFQASWTGGERLELSIGAILRPPQPAVPLPSLTWVPTTLGVLTPPVTGFVYFLVVLLLFISWWPDLRRDLVMTFASRDSRLTVLKILNEVEAQSGRLSSDRHLHQPLRRGSRRRDRVSDRVAVPLRLRRARGDAQLHPDRRADPDDRRAGAGRNRRRAEPRSRAPAGGALHVGGLREGQFITPTIIGRQTRDQQPRRHPVASLLDLDVGADGGVPRPRRC